MRVNLEFPSRKDRKQRGKRQCLLSMKSLKFCYFAPLPSAKHVGKKFINESNLLNVSSWDQLTLVCSRISKLFGNVQKSYQLKELREFNELRMMKHVLINFHSCIPLSNIPLELSSFPNIFENLSKFEFAFKRERKRPNILRCNIRTRFNLITTVSETSNQRRQSGIQNWTWWWKILIFQQDFPISNHLLRTDKLSTTTVVNFAIRFISICLRGIFSSLSLSTELRSKWQCKWGIGNWKLQMNMQHISNFIRTRTSMSSKPKLMFKHWEEIWNFSTHFKRHKISQLQSLETSTWVSWKV